MKNICISMICRTADFEFEFNVSHIMLPDLSCDCFILHNDMVHTRKTYQWYR